jgi:hypothetical protein
VKPVKKFFIFLKPEGLLPYSQEPPNCSYPQPDESNPRPPISLKIYFNIIFPYTHRTFKVTTYYYVDQMKEDAVDGHIAHKELKTNGKICLVSKPGGRNSSPLWHNRP